MPHSSTRLRLVALPAPGAAVPADAAAFDLGPARRFLVGLVAALMVALGAAGWAHSDFRTAWQVHQAQNVRAA